MYIYILIYCIIAQSSDLNSCLYKQYLFLFRWYVCFRTYRFAIFDLCAHPDSGRGARMAWRVLYAKDSGRAVVFIKAIQFNVRFVMADTKVTARPKFAGYILHQDEWISSQYLSAVWWSNENNQSQNFFKRTRSTPLNVLCWRHCNAQTYCRNLFFIWHLHIKPRFPNYKNI